MSEPAPPPAPVPAPPQPGLVQRAEQAAERLLHGPAETAIADEIKVLLRGHSAALIRVAADVIEARWPGAEPVASKVLEVALGVAKVAGIAL